MFCGDECAVAATLPQRLRLVTCWPLLTLGPLCITASKPLQGGDAGAALHYKTVVVAICAYICISGAGATNLSSLSAMRNVCPLL